MPDTDDHWLATFLQPVTQHIGTRPEGREQFSAAIAQGLADLGKALQLARGGLDAENGVARRLGALPSEKIIEAQDVSQRLGQPGYSGHPSSTLFA